MKSTGIIRKLDELGRVVIPIELRNKFNISEKDPIEIYVEGSNIILKKYEVSCILNKIKDDNLNYHLFYSIQNLLISYRYHFY